MFAYLKTPGHSSCKEWGSCTKNLTVNFKDCAPAANSEVRVSLWAPETVDISINFLYNRWIGIPFESTPHYGLYFGLPSWIEFYSGDVEWTKEIKIKKGSFWHGGGRKDKQRQRVVRHWRRMVALAGKYKTDRQELSRGAGFQVGFFSARASTSATVRSWIFKRKDSLPSLQW